MCLSIHSDNLLTQAKEPTHTERKSTNLKVSSFRLMRGMCRIRKAKVGVLMIALASEVTEYEVFLSGESRNSESRKPSFQLLSHCPIGDLSVANWACLNASSFSGD